MSKGCGGREDGKAVMEGQVLVGLTEVGDGSGDMVSVARDPGGELGRIHIEEKGFERWPGRLMVASREQLLLPPELEGHGARDDALGAPDDFSQLEALALARIGDGAP